MDAPPDWVSLNDDALLEKRISQLGLQLADSKLQPLIQQLYAELSQKRLVFHPPCHVGDEWFVPVGVPAIFIPFFLVHDRLRQLERRLMLEVEGDTPEWFMKLIRHEAAHAYAYAYQVFKKRAWQRVFGRSSAEGTPSFYRPRPYSRSFVVHLDDWYAQSHPTEDFAETFAVWLPRNSRWRSQYTGWPALRKLQYVDATMRNLHGKRAVSLNREVIEPLADNTRTLREHYRRKQRRYELNTARTYDRRLLRVFGTAEDHPASPQASRFLRKVQPQVERLMIRRARMHPYLVQHVLKIATQRARLMNLRLSQNQRDTKRAVLVMLERIMLEMLLRDRENYAL